MLFGHPWPANHAIRSVFVPLSGHSESAPVQSRFGCASLTLRIPLRALRVPLRGIVSAHPVLRLGRTGGHLLITRSRVFETGVSPNRDTGGWLALTGYGLSVNLPVNGSLYKRRQAFLGVPT